MKKLKKLSALAPVLSAVALTVCMLISLSNYDAPVYEIEAAEMVTEESEESEITEGEAKESAETESRAEASEAVLGSTGAAQTVAATASDGEDSAVFDLSAIADGVYEGEGTGFAGKIRVSVEIKDKKIVSIQIISVEADDTSFVERAKGVIDSILAAQSVDVDTVSGATYSSRGIIRAVKNALTGEADDGQAASAAGSLGTGAGATSLPPVTDAGAYKDGVYEGSGTGFAGEVKVEVTIADGKITKIEITRIADGTDYVTKASAVINSIIKAQSTNVDTVSGATYSSVGIISAVRDALSKAATDEQDSSEEDEENTGQFPYNDGVYYGTADGFSGDITVAVAISDETIQAIVVTDAEDDESYLSRAKTVLSKIIKKQSTKVDTVSGATYSSGGMIQAVKNALKEAKRITAGEETESSEEETALTGTIPYDEGVYYGTGSGFSGDITVAVAIADNTIKAIIVVSSEDDAEFFDRARTLIDTVLAGQSTQVDTVSGATFSSEGLLEAIDQALLAAKNATEGAADTGNTESGDATQASESSSSQSETSGDVTSSSESADSDTAQTSETEDAESTESSADGGSIYQDGTYTVTVECSPDEEEAFESYHITATVTIQNDKIVSVTDITCDDDTNMGYVNRAANGTSKITGVVEQIVSNGNADGIDAVSMATCSSEAIIAACRQALADAKK